MVIAQLALSFLALMTLYYSAVRLFKSPKAGLITGIAFLGFAMISFWNFWIYCESLLISLNCLAFFFLVKWLKGEATTSNLILGIPLILAAVFTKPTGIALLGAIAAALSYRYLFVGAGSGDRPALSPFRRLRPSLSVPLLSLVLLAATVVFLLLLNKMLSTFTFRDDYRLGEVVYNIHRLADQPYAGWLMIQPPDPLYQPDAHWPPLVQFMALILGNPWYSLKLFAAKLFYQLFYIRPYYSWGHNAAALLVLLPLYGAAVRELTRPRILPEIKLLFLVFFAISTLAVALLTVDWNGRFLMPLLPMVFLKGAGGLQQFERIRS